MNLQEEKYYKKYKSFLNEAKTSDQQQQSLKDKIDEVLENAEVYATIKDYEEEAKENKVNFNLEFALDNNTIINIYYLFNQNNIDMELSVISEANKEKLPVSIPLDERFLNTLNKIHMVLTETLPEVMKEFF